MSSVLKRISFTAVDGFRVAGEGITKYKLIVPVKAEVMISKELEPYFTVVRK